MKIKKMAMVLGLMLASWLFAGGAKEEGTDGTTIEFFLGKRECIATFESLI